MNNDELKKKIVEVLKPVIRAGNISCNEENACKKCWFPCEIERTAGRLADALIAAGIGDVKEAKFESDHYWRMWQGSLVELERAEHRAEVAEKDNIKYGRALYNLAVKYVASANIWTITADDGKKYLAEKEICALNVIDSEIKNAEKELAEENSGKKEV